MPESITTVLVRKDETIHWDVSEVTHEDCGQTFLIAETSVIGFTGSAEALEQFTVSLLIAIRAYQEGKRDGNGRSQ